MNTDITTSIILKGDLGSLTQAQKVEYYNQYCSRLGLDPFTQPFSLLKLSGREILYLTRSGAQQLNKLHQVSHTITSRELIDAAGVYQVTARASLPDGRCTESIGAVNIGGLKGEAYSNSIMKAETKAKRRATLDLLGLGVLDETEVETIPGVIEPSKIDYLHDLLSTSSYDDETKMKLTHRLDSISSEDEYQKALNNLMMHQLDPITHGSKNSSYNQADIRDHLKKLA